MKAPTDAEMLDAMLERDLALLNLDEIIHRCEIKSGVTDEIVRSAILAIGPAIFRTAYYRGAKAGMQLCRDIHARYK